MGVKSVVVTFVFLLYCILGLHSKDILGGQTSEVPSYTVVYPQLVQRRWTRDANKPPESEKREGAESLAYSLSINHEEHFLHLTKNKDFLYRDFVQYAHDASGDLKPSYPKPHVHCYYHGQVEGHEGSLVALSTCSGLRGVILFGNESYGLEPAPQSTDNEHRLFHLNHSHPEPVVCGVTSETSHTESHSSFDPTLSMTALLRRKRNLPETRYVELVLVADNLRFNFKQRNVTAVREEMVELANLLDGYYKQLNIRVVLVGLEIFSESNPFDVNGSPGQVLGAFVNWRKTSLIPRIRHDVGQLMVGRPDSYNGVLGMAFVGTVCSVATAGGINVFSNDNLPYVSTVVAHEMGHNLGMNHDSGRCTCNGEPCIMAATASGSTNFSTCSADDFERLILRGGGVCLKNQPSPSDVVNVAKCGNGMLEEGEQCDCGTPEECTDRCCEAATCQFTSGSACAQGGCCRNCQIRVAGTRCRGSVNSCDLPEFCNGETAFCPEDYYVMDGLSCESNAAYCYEGRCQTYDFQCRHLFESGASKAADICFQHANTKGNMFGNCGTTSAGDFIKCAVADAMCGKVQCTGVDTNNPPPGVQVSNQLVEGFSCVNADFNLGTDVLDPAYVNPGSPCAKGKTCLDFKCINASALMPNLNCDAQSTCSGNGVCNDQGNCHCGDGWAPPRCDKSGRGGSVDSGPAQIDYSLRNGLLIFFLLVVPILILIVLVLLFVFRRDSLEHCFKRSRSSRSRSQNAPNGQANSQANVNVQKNAPPKPQVPPTQTMPAYPSTTSDPSLRHGELDYWNTQTNSVTHAANPRQGPGVPRPIPSRGT